MPGENPFDNFRFPDPVELEPLEPYEGVAVGYEENYGGEPNEPRLDPLLDTENTFHYRPFQLYGLHKDGANWYCYVAEGVVIDTHVRNAGYDSSGETDENLDNAARLTVPTIDGVPIIQPCDSSGKVDVSWERPRLLIGSNPIGKAYLNFCTDPHGWIISCDSSGAGLDLVTIVWSADEDSVKTKHHIPPKEGDDGEDGTYYFQLGATCYTADNNPIIIHEGHQSNFQWQEAFVTENWESSGDLGEHVLNGFMKKKDAFRMRSIRGCYALKATKIKKTVILEWQGDNCSAYTDESVGRANIYIDSGESCEEIARFRFLRQGEAIDRREIEIIQGTKHVIVQGNGVTGSLRLLDCDSTSQVFLEWRDGLMLTPVHTTFKAGCDSSGISLNGVNGSLTLLDCDSAAQVVLAWSNGLITTVGNKFFKAGCDSSGATALTSVTGGYGLTATGTPTTVDLDLDAENVGTGSAGVYVDTAGVVDADPARFRRLVQTTEAGITPQIVPVKVGNTVEIRGNGVNGSLIWDTCNGSTQFTIEWKDGLITTSGNHLITAGCDSSGWIPPVS